jgi:N-acetyl-anhydromuramyl-L-alanine amidase AmpD
MFRSHACLARPLGLVRTRGLQRFRSIELEGADQEPYDDRQYPVLAALITALQRAYPSLASGAIAGHSDIAPGRKTDPGPAFDWRRLEREVVFAGGRLRRERA